MKRSRTAAQIDLMSAVQAWKRQKRTPIPRALSYRGSANGTIVKIKQFFNAGSIQVTSGGATLVSLLQFDLNNLPNDAEYKGLFSMYRFDKAVVHFLSNQPGPGVGAAATPSVAGSMLYTAKEYAGATPASAATILEYETCKFVNPTRSIVRTVKPQFIGGNTTTFNAKAVWVPTANDTSLWSGLVYALTVPSVATSVIGYTVMVEYHMEFKNIN
jgi:hypothetical protein